MIKKLSFIFGSKTKAQEMALLINNYKEVVRQGFYEPELPLVEKFCQEQHLFLVISTFKVLFADEDLYSNKGIRIPENDPRAGMRFIYISGDEENAWLASYYEMMNNHQDLGLILGYPSCCVEFFCRNFSEKRANLEVAPTNPWTDLSQREKDCVLLSHFPCSSDCPASVELAKKYYQHIRKVDQVRAEELRQGLGI